MTVSASKFHGGSDSHPSMSADIELVAGSKRVQYLVPQFLGLKVNLPDARTLATGGPHFFLLNDSGGLGVTVRDATNSNVGVLTQNSGWEVHLVDNSTEAGVWVYISRTLA
jgi:hypothetical protein